MKLDQARSCHDAIPTRQCGLLVKIYDLQFCPPLEVLAAEFFDIFDGVEGIQVVSRDVKAESVARSQPPFE